MAGQRQPTDLVVMKGKKHLTKAEIEARKNAEVVAPNDKVKPPAYLTPEQKKKFRKLSKELLAIKLIANVDCDALARLLIAQDQYIEITDKIRETPLMVDVPVYEMRENPDTGEQEKMNSKSYRKSLTSCLIWTRRNMRRSRTRWRREQQRPSGEKRTRKTS